MFLQSHICQRMADVGHPFKIKVKSEVNCPTQARSRFEWGSERNPI
jgi:hypothetical protein